MKTRAAPGRTAPNPSEPASAADLRAERLVGVALAITALAWAAGGFLDSGWWWGLGTLRPLPAFERYALLGVVALGFVPPVARALGAGLEVFGDAWKRSGWRGDLVACGAVFAAVFALRDGVRFTGDFQMRVGLLDMNLAGANRLMRYAFPLDVAINTGFPRLIAARGLAPATALQLTGALAGTAYAFVAIQLVRVFAGRGDVFVAGVFTVLAGGALVHFAGYDKFGPLLVGLALASLGAVRLHRDGRGLVVLTAGASIALLSHRSAFLLIPAVAMMLWFTLRRANTAAARAGVVISAALIAMAAAAVAPHTIGLARELDLPNHLPGGAVARGRESAAEPATARLAHALNLASFLVPLWLAGLTATAALWGTRDASGGEKRRRAGIPLGLPAALALGAFAALVVAVTPGGGWPRDWDVALGFAALASVATAVALVRVWNRAPGSLGPAQASLLALATATALWTIHADDATHRRQIDGLLAEASLWSASTRANACDLLGAQEWNAGRMDRAAWYFERAIESAPNPRFFHQLGVVRLEQGRIAEAAAEFRRSLERNPKVADAWAGLARAAVASGDSAKALAYADSALARSPRHPVATALKAELGRARR